MKKSLMKIVLATMIAVAPLAASDDYTYKTETLFAIEGGIANVDTEQDGGLYNEEELLNFGMKIGAQTEHYRIFLGARHYMVDDLNSLNTFGAEIQYMFNFTEPVNFFIGLNGGIANITAAKDGTPSQTVRPMYLGFDTGFNIHITPMFDLELAARYSEVENEMVGGVVVDDIAAVYASFIVKYQMD